jgi:hypothetical protein
LVKAFEVFACIAVLLLAVSVAGCARTPDGSYVMRKPASFGKAFMRRSTSTGLSAAPAGPAFAEADAAFVAPAPAEAAEPPATSEPRRQVARKLPPVVMPSMGIVRNPPFIADADKPLSCTNEPTTAGRIRVVCM